MGKWRPIKGGDLLKITISQGENLIISSIIVTTVHTHTHTQAGIYSPVTDGWRSGPNLYMSP